MRFYESRSSLAALCFLATILTGLFPSYAAAQEVSEAPGPKTEVTSVVRGNDGLTITVRIPKAVTEVAEEPENALLSSADVVPLGVLSVPYTTSSTTAADSVHVLTAFRRRDGENEKFWLDCKCFRLNKQGKMEQFDGFTVAEDDTENLFAGITPSFFAETGPASDDTEGVTKTITRGKYTYYYNNRSLRRYHAYVTRSRSWFTSARAWSSKSRQARASEESSLSSGGTVSVKGYYRKDGTYVRPHTRSAPGSGRRGH